MKESAAMIANDQELQVTQEQIAHFQHWLVALRQTARPEEFETLTSGYHLEIERMQAEVLDYWFPSVFGRA